MNKRRFSFRDNSIQTKLVMLQSSLMLLILLVNLFIYWQTNSMVRRIDSVFASNVTIGELTDTIELVQTSVYEYLNTKSSEALENYYRYGQEYRTLIGQLNTETVSSPLLILEKNIHSMSGSYMNKMDETVQAKRGRNVEHYKQAYEEGTKLYEYINYYIYRLNSLQFEQNSKNYEFLLSVMGGMEVFSLAIIIVVFGVALSAVILIIRDMIHPLQKLSEAAGEVAQGNFEVTLPQTDSRDEIGIVTKTFAQMLSSIRAYISRLRDSMEKEAQMKERELSMEAHLKEAQLKFLQAQINPHFLFNSLNAGAQLAMMEDAEATGSFLEKMADFFRYNVKKMNGSSTLREELELVDNYIYILNVRFAGDISYEKHIEQGFDDTQMPGMILQPLVENAVTHGIRDRIQHSRIILTAEQYDKMLQVTVTDNGRGMTRDELASVMADISSGAPQETRVRNDLSEPEDAQSQLREQEKNSTGIGLRNVSNRLNLFYKRDGLLSIYSEGRDQGTEVTVLLPLTQEEQRNVSDTDRG